MRIRSNLPFGLLAGGAMVLVVAVLAVRPDTAGAPQSPAPEESSRSIVAVATPKPNATSLPGIELDPNEPAVAPPGECGLHTTILDWIPAPIETSAAMASGVVRARVEAIGEGQWNTKDGSIPEEHITGLDVMRLIRVENPTTLTGSAATTTFWVPGGNIGCHQYVVSGFDFKIGEEYLFFLASRAPKSGIAGTVEVMEAWPIRSGKVQSPFDGELPMNEVVTRVAKALE